MHVQSERLGHAEILRLLSSGTESDDELILNYLHEVAESFTVDEAFAVITLVDTPDVFD